MDPQKPQPPDDLDGEALLEWQRITTELAAHELLDAADRALLTLYVQTWAANQHVARHVAKHGPVVKWSNGVPGQGPWFKTQKETTALLASLLAQLGLTPAARAKLAATKQPEGDGANASISF